MTNEIINQNFEDIEIMKEKILLEFNLHYLQCCEKVLEVTCYETAKNALSMALQSRKIEQALDKSRSEIIRPHLDYQRSINKLVKDLREKLSAMEESLQKKIEIWMKDQEDNPFLTVNEIKVEDGCLYKKTYWDFTIEDEAKIPREYLQVDVNLVEQAMQNGIREIEGVKIELKEKIMIRVKN